MNEMYVYARMVSEAHPKDSTDAWLYVLDETGEIIAQFMGAALTVAGLTNGLKAVAAVNLKNARFVGVVHERKLTSHQARMSWTDVKTKERTGFVMRGEEILDATLSKKDGELFTRLEKSLEVEDD